MEAVEVKNNFHEDSYSYLVLKTDRGYFENAWEYWGDEENFSFTYDIEKAYKFKGGLTPSWGNAPKYLSDDKGKTIDNLKEAHEYFGGRIVMVTYTRVVTEKYEFEALGL